VEQPGHADSHEGECKEHDQGGVLEPLVDFLAVDRCLADAKRDRGLPRG
jgi:hypothetical protein